MKTTRLSSKGQITIPKATREAHHWEAGIEFAVQDTKAGILLTPRLSFKKTNLDEVAGCAGYQGTQKNIKAGGKIDRGLF